MRRTGAAIVVAVAFVLPCPTVFADERAGDNHGFREPCRERERVLGHRTCPAYGEWARDELYVAVTFGFNLRHLPADSVAPGAAARTTTSTGIDDPASSSSYMVSEQIAVAPTPASLVGFEIEIAPSTSDQIAPGEHEIAAAAHLVAGLHGGNTLFRLGGELAGGVRFVNGETDQAEQGVLEARLRCQLWLSPWVAAGVLVGTSLLERGDWVAGISLGTHSFGFGGR
jgi:hypothetical protein